MSTDDQKQNPLLGSEDDVIKKIQNYSQEVMTEIKSIQHQIKLLDMQRRERELERIDSAMMKLLEQQLLLIKCVNEKYLKKN